MVKTASEMTESGTKDGVTVNVVGSVASTVKHDGEVVLGSKQLKEVIREGQETKYMIGGSHPCLLLTG